MPVRKLGLLATLLALGLLSITSSASATTFLRTDPGNAVLPAGSTIAAGSPGTMTLDMSATGATLTCTASTFAAGFASSSGNPSVAGTLGGITFSSCTDNMPIWAFADCATVATLPSVSITAGAGGGTFSMADTYLRCGASGTSQACYLYLASAVGSFANVSSTLSYSSVSVVRTAPSAQTDDLGAACPLGSTGELSMSFRDVSRTTYDTSASTTTVTVTKTVTAWTTTTALGTAVTAATKGGTVTVTTG